MQAEMTEADTLKSPLTLKNEAAARAAEQRRVLKTGVVPRVLRFVNGVSYGGQWKDKDGTQ